MEAINEGGRPSDFTQELADEKCESIDEQKRKQ